MRTGQLASAPGKPITNRETSHGEHNWAHNFKQAAALMHPSQFQS
jgi:hypothetical protein